MRRMVVEFLTFTVPREKLDESLGVIDAMGKELGFQEVSRGYVAQPQLQLQPRTIDTLVGECREVACQRPCDGARARRSSHDLVMNSLGLVFLPADGHEARLLR